MTPKEKAEELITKFQHPMSEMSDTDCLHIAVAKEFSLIAVDEMIAELAYIRNYDEEINEKMIIKIDQRQDFLIEVEKEIKAL
jgi:hypothetical protein